MEAYGYLRLSPKPYFLIRKYSMNRETSLLDLPLLQVPKSLYKNIEINGIWGVEVIFISERLGRLFWIQWFIERILNSKREP